MLQINNLTFAYDQENIIENFNLEVSRNDIVALIGRSGCGKSTIINCCATILNTNNTIKYNGNYISAKKLKIGLVMQDLGLLSWLNVKDNCLLPYKIKKIAINQEIQVQLENVAQKLNIAKLLSRKVDSISGGQQQRVSLTRLFTFNPDYILLDEAFSSLDLLNKDEAIKLFIEIWNERKVPTLMVTHSIDEALLMANKIVVLEDKGEIKDTINNPLFQCIDYKKRDEYGSLYYKIEQLIKGDKNEE